MTTSPLPCHPREVPDKIIAALRLLLIHDRPENETAWRVRITVEELRKWRPHASVLLRCRPDMDDTEMWRVVALCQPPTSQGMYAPTWDDPTWSVDAAEKWIYAVSRGCDAVEACRFSSTKKHVVQRWIEMGEGEGAADPYKTFAIKANEVMVRRIVNADNAVLDVLDNGKKDGDRLKAAELVKTWANPDRYGRRSNVDKKVTIEGRVVATQVSVLADMSVEDVAKLLDASRERRMLSAAAAPIDASNVIDVLSADIGAGDGK